MKKYEKAEIEIVELNLEDIITGTSGTELPIDPENSQ